MAVLVGATALVDSRVLAMGRAVVGAAGYNIGTVSSGFRPGARVEGTGAVSLHSHRPSLAIDIAATGDKLTRLGQAALRLAGVANPQAYTSWSGQDTPGGWEILFHTQVGGNHETHLHLGYRGVNANVPTSPAGGGGLKSHYNFNDLMLLWVNNGGARQHAAMAAQVALLESGGDTHANLHTIKEDSRGLWQINIKRNAHPEYAHADLYNPQVNVKAAIAISKNGTEWSQWSTANAARAALITRGKVMPPSVSRPGGADGGGGGLLGGIGGVFGGAGSALGSIWNWGDRPVSDIFNLPNPLAPVADLVKLFIWLFSPTNWLRMIEFIMGVLLLLLGIATLIVEFSRRSTPTGRFASAITSRVPLGRQLSDFERGAARGVREREYNEGRRAARTQETRSNPDAFRPQARYR